ncbi:MAG: TetR/AcrR family transcriptional regulator [Cyclobacteriaceae bacterium]|nr:TetR family transcriptional regulator [Cyclobacteriaceae bacterium]MCH8514830.1 TetR/AcrR family transcriptional regulator [Cyclobacteriaceae bacterium]
MMMLVKNRKEQIYSEATKLFRDKGYSATSMRDLAQCLGIEAASLYSHIRSKEEILQQICFRMADEFFSRLNTIDREASVSEQLRESMIIHVGVITQDTAASAVFFNEWRHLGEESLAQFIEMRNRYEQHYIDIFQIGMDSGELKVKDPKFAMLSALSFLNWTHNWFKPNRKMNSREVGELLAERFLHGIVNK